MKEESKTSFQLLGLTLSVVALMIMSFRQGAHYDQSHPIQTQDPCPESYISGRRDGIMVCVNYDMKGAGQKPYTSWTEFENSTKESKAKMASMDSFFKELDEQMAAHHEAQKKYPPSPWLPKERTAK